jgi:hypothetical protein
MIPRGACEAVMQPLSEKACMRTSVPSSMRSTTVILDILSNQNAVRASSAAAIRPEEEE